MSFWEEYLETENLSEQQIEEIIDELHRIDNVLSEVGVELKSYNILCKIIEQLKG